MNKIYIGKIVGTHGIKGEVKILSNFQYKNKVFIIGNKLLIDNQEYIIKSYRHHKKFEMVTLNDYNNINHVLYLIQKDVYIYKNELELESNEILDSELICFKVINNSGENGIIKEIFLASPNNKIMRIMFSHEVLIPMNSPYLKINKDKQEVYINLIEGM